ncbi:Rgg/GadR/MutR family transcriptional regulator [Streptococcus suis]|nr:Rgg/GadR/MutR family transcriptional regulator [Streptococcus suis]
MEIKHMGQILKQLRHSRKLSLKAATGGDFSVSMLSRFENGESDLTTLKLLTVLENIRTEPEEFFYLIRGFKTSSFSALIQEIREAQDKNTIDSVWQLYQQEVDHFQKENKPTHLLNALIIKGNLHTFDNSIQASKEELDFFYDYLFSVDIWGEYELNIFTEVSVLLPLESYFFYCRELLTKIDYFEKMFIIRNRIHTILLNGLFLAIKEKDLHKANYFDKQIKQRFFEENEAYLRIVYRFAQGMLQFQFNKSNDGLKTMEQAVQVLDFIGCEQLASYYKEGLNKLLKKESSNKISK